MEPVPQNVRVVRRAYWLIRLRWFAVAGVIATVFFADQIAKISLAVTPLYSIAVILGVYNTTVLLILNRITGSEHDSPHPGVKRIISLQMSIDLFLLTLLLHFSGGIENPFVIYYIFHMILASILLSPKESYLQATLGSGFLLLMTLLEYQGFVEYYHLEGFIPHDVHNEGFYLFSKVFILSSAFYLVVFMTSSIAVIQRKQEEGYRLANIELETKDRVKDEYVARVTHDIKGHLAAIQSCLDAVCGGMAGDLNANQQDLVDRADGRVRKLTKFVRSLLRLTRMRLSDEFYAKPFDVSAVIDKAYVSVEENAADKSITLKKSCKEPLGEVVGDPFSVEELITNLMLNAIKYTPEGGKVWVFALKTGNFVKIDVSDSGIGIPADEVGRVFDEFYRASNAKETEKDGTGLGLSIAKQIVERHGGEISVKSTENEGTTFSFTLRVKPE